MLGLRKLISKRRGLESYWQSNRDFKACGPKIRGADRTVVQTNRFRGNSKPETISVRPFLVSANSIKRFKDCLQRLIRHSWTVIPNSDNGKVLWRILIGFQNDFDIRS